MKAKKYWLLCPGCRCVSVPADEARCPPCSRKIRARASRPGSHGNAARAARYAVEHEPVSRRKVYERDGWRCGICRKRINRELKYPDPMSASLDHVVPMALGGNHTYVNAQAAHLICNQRKSWIGTGDQLALLG